MFAGEMAPQPMMPAWLCRLRNSGPIKQRGAGGKLRGSWSMATNVARDTQLPWIACEDIGEIVAAILKQVGGAGRAPS